MWHGQIEGTDIIVLDPRFCFAGHVRVERSGARWAEGPAWFAAGRYLVWSDIPNNRMMRFVEPSGEVSVFRERSNNSNGNTVDNQSRLVTCERLTRRVTRTEDAEIKIGNIKPYSGPASSYGVIGKPEEAYFRKIKRETLLRKARQAETAAHVDEWLSSPGPTRRCACASVSCVLRSIRRSDGCRCAACRRVL